MTNFRPHYNYVLIAPDAHHVAGTHGVVTADAFDRQNDFAVTGEIVGVCDSLLYFGRELRKIGDVSRAAPLRQARALDMAKATCSYDVPIEVRAGDRVAFPYLFHLTDSATADYEHTIDGLLLIEYHELVARINKDGSLYPLNGRVLGTVGNKESVAGMEGLKQQRSDIYTVVAEGCHVRHYCDYGYPDDRIRITGRRAIVEGRQAVSLEVPGQVRLHDERLFYFHRRNIIGYV